MTDPDQHTRELAADGGPTAWFDRLYQEAAAGTAVVPWDRGAPHPLLAPWLDELDLDPRGRQALTVGCGLGADAELPPIELSAVGRENVALGALAAGQDVAQDTVLAQIES